MGRQLTGLIGDALVAFIECTWPSRPKMDAFFERVRDAVRPDPPITLVTLDGAVLTGLIVLERGQGLAFIGTRQPAPTASTRPPFTYHDEPIWAREDDPYRR